MRAPIETGAAGRADGERHGSSPIRLDYFPAPEPMRHHITTLFSIAADREKISDVLPAAVGYLIVVLEGHGQVVFGNGAAAESGPVILLTPTSTAVRFEFAGPLAAVGAVLSPLGWAALTGLPADEHGDRLYDAAAWLGPEIAELAGQFRAAYAAGIMQPEQMADALAGFIGGRLGKVNPRHVQLMQQVMQWLGSGFDPPLSALHESSSYSTRQLQRLVERYYGVPPKQLLRKYRALRVAALLAAPDTTEEQVAELLNLFYDQSHLIREISLFTGRTPARLGDGSAPLQEAVIDVRNYREVTPNVAPMPKAQAKD